MKLKSLLCLLLLMSCTNTTSPTTEIAAEPVSSTMAPAATQKQDAEVAPVQLPYFRQGFLFILVAVVPNKKAVKAQDMQLRNLLLDYNGSSWLPHISTIPWYSGEYALVVMYSELGAAIDFCSWVRDVGWVPGGVGLTRKRFCEVLNTRQLLRD